MKNLNDEDSSGKLLATQLESLVDCLNKPYEASPAVPHMGFFILATNVSFFLSIFAKEISKTHATDLDGLVIALLAIELGDFEWAKEVIEKEAREMRNLRDFDDKSFWKAIENAIARKERSDRWDSLLKI